MAFGRSSQRLLVSTVAVFAWIGLLAPVLIARPARGATRSEELVKLANSARSAARLQPLEWDDALAAAAHDHALRMAASSSISHRYQGEKDLAERTSSAGARFSLIEENVAAGPTTLQVHNGWMHSQGHRENLLNPSINRIGVAVVAAQGLLFVVVDYSQFTPSLTQTQVESTVGRLLYLRGLDLVDDPALARHYCASVSGGLSTYPSETGQMARFGMRWQASDISVLPQQLEDRIAGGRFHRAAVGGCTPPRGSLAQSAFSSYRVGVILY